MYLFLLTRLSLGGVSMLPGLLPRLEQELKELVFSSFVFSLVSKVGRRLEILMNATSRRNFNGDIVGVVCIGQVKRGFVFVHVLLHGVYRSTNSLLLGYH